MAGCSAEPCQGGPSHSWTAGRPSQLGTNFNATLQRAWIRCKYCEYCCHGNNAAEMGPKTRVNSKRQLQQCWKAQLVLFKEVAKQPT